MMNKWTHQHQQGPQFLEGNVTHGQTSGAHSQLIRCLQLAVLRVCPVDLQSALFSLCQKESDPRAKSLGLRNDWTKQQQQQKTKQCLSLRNTLDVVSSNVSKILQCLSFALCSFCFVDGQQCFSCFHLDVCAPLGVQSLIESYQSSIGPFQIRGLRAGFCIAPFTFIQVNGLKEQLHQSLFRRYVRYTIKVFYKDFL